MIRLACPADIPRLVEIHRSALPDDFLPRLGGRFLSRVFFPNALQSNQAFTLLFEGGGQAQAFVIFATNSRSFTCELKRARLAVAVSLIRNLWRDPLLWLDAARLTRGSQIQLTAPVERFFERPELYLIAVDPACQGRGMGSALVREGLRMLRDAHTYCVVRTSSARARSFYRALDFRDLGTELRGQRRLFVLGCTLQ